MNDRIPAPEVITPTEIMKATSEFVFFGVVPMTFRFDMDIQSPENDNRKEPNVREDIKKAVDASFSSVMSAYADRSIRMADLLKVASEGLKGAAIKRDYSIVFEMADILDNLSTTLQLDAARAIELRKKFNNPKGE